MRIIKKIYDFVAKSFSKHFWRAGWLEFRACSYKSVDAKTLEELCGYVNPSHKRLIEIVNEAGGNDLHLRENSSVIGAFYADRDNFLRGDDFRGIIMSDDKAKSLHEKLENFLAFSSDEFHARVKRAGLEGNVVLLGLPGEIDSRLEFKNIKVHGNINLFLGGRLNFWKFKQVKFCGETVITTFPSKKPGGGLYFSDNIFGSRLTVFFPGISYIDIRGNIFKNSVRLMFDGNAVQNGDAFGSWIKHMLTPSSDNPATVGFSNNYAEGLINLSDSIYTNRPSIGMISFTDGNVIGGLSVPAVSPLDDDDYPMACNELHQEFRRTARIGDIHFDVNERIKLPSSKHDAAVYKDYFISLKDRAIKMRDSEAEFKYSRQERYFDRGIATRWQDKFILWWSHMMSDSGISWIRPIGWLLLVQATLAAAFVCWSGCSWDWRVWAELAVESLNPLSSVDTECASTLSAAIYNVARKIFLFLFLYETIKVFRRFSK